GGGRGGGVVGGVRGGGGLVGGGGGGGRDEVQRDRAAGRRRRRRGDLLDAHRLRAAVLSEPARWRSALRPRRMRRQGNSRSSGGRRRSAASRRRDAPRPGPRGRRRARPPRRAPRRRRGRAGAGPAKAAAGGAAGRALINGAPTDTRLGLATRGILRLKLRASGRAAHSSFPELGESAIDKLIDALVELRSIALPDDPVLGRTHYTLGLIEGGIAPNVVSPSAEAEVMFRTV